MENPSVFVYESVLDGKMYDGKVIFLKKLVSSIIPKINSKLFFRFLKCDF